MTLFWLGTEPGTEFPPAECALAEPNGLLAAGGDLSIDRLLSAYRRGIFPWYSAGQPILWWSPDPRMVLVPGEFHASRSLRRTYRRHDWELSINRGFADVIDACAEPRDGETGTWITPEMRTAYLRLHEAGWAHSIEVTLDGRLVGGLYGVAIDRVFFGESMFHRVTDASKLALWFLCARLVDDGFALLDCQMHTEHLATLGARRIGRREFLSQLGTACCHLKSWNPAPISSQLA